MQSSNITAGLCFCSDAECATEVYIECKGSARKFKPDFPMGVREMLAAMQHQGHYHVYCLLNADSGCSHQLIRIIHPSLLVRQGELKYRLEL